MKLILIKNALNNKDDIVARTEYTQFENENEFTGHEVITTHDGFDDIKNETKV